jgi:hypothetical protein
MPEPTTHGFFRHGRDVKPRTREQLDKLLARERKRYATAKLGAGAPVSSLQDLVYLARTRKSVFVEGCFGLKPAAFIANQTGTTLHNLFERQAIRRYTPVADLTARERYMRARPDGGY